MKGAEDPYTFYTLLNNVKNDLIWGLSTSDEDDFDTDKEIPSRYMSEDQWLNKNTSSSSSSSTVSSNQNQKGHMRRQSTLSMISVNSTSDGESEACSDAGDSGLEVEDSLENAPVVNAKNTISDLKSHLIGLHGCLADLTDSANYITVRYQEEVNK